MLVMLARWRYAQRLFHVTFMESELVKSKKKTQGAITGVVAGEISLGSSPKSLLSAGAAVGS